MKSPIQKIGMLVIAVLIAVGTVGIVNYIKDQGTSAHQGHVKALYQCPMHPTYTSDQKGDCPICGMKLVEVEQTEEIVDEGNHVGHEGSGGAVATTDEKEQAKSVCLFHECPMLKEGRICSMLIFTEDGKTPVCPVCNQKLTGQELVPVEQPKDITGYTAVTLSDKKLQMIGIRTSPIEERQASKSIRTVGKIAYDPELYQAEEEYLQALGAWKKAKTGGDPEIAARAERLVESSRIRLELFGLNQKLIAEIEELGKPDKSLILAEAGGTVWMYAPIYEQEMDVIKEGQTVRVTAPTVIPGKEFSGTIRGVDSVLDPKTRSVRIRAVLDNEEGHLKPNVYVNVVIEVDLGKQILIPEDAVLDSGERRIAFVALRKGVFEPRVLILGPKLEDDFVVISGVSTGEEVVSQATFFVDSESKLKAAVGQSAGGAHAGHGG